jgi:hypothetical protein
MATALENTAQPWGQLQMFQQTYKTLGMSKTSMHVFQENECVMLSKPIYTVGKSNCDIVITEALFGHKRFESISGRHFTISCDINNPKSPVILTDTATNRTYVNGQLIGKDNKSPPI